MRASGRGATNRAAPAVPSVQSFVVYACGSVGSRLRMQESRCIPSSGLPSPLTLFVFVRVPCLFSACSADFKYMWLNG